MHKDVQDLTVSYLSYIHMAIDNNDDVIDVDVIFLFCFKKC